MNIKKKKNQLLLKKSNKNKHTTYQIPLFSIKWVGELAAFTQGEIANNRT